MSPYNIEDVEKSFLKAFPFPAILFKVTSMLEDETVSLIKLGQEISKDPVLTAKILSISNSSHYGAKRKIKDLPHAISMLGREVVSATVMSFAAKKSLLGHTGQRNTPLYSARAGWLHSIKVALLSRILVKKNKLPFLVEGYLAGLMHDIGKNAIGVAIEPKHEKKILFGVNNGIQQIQMEKLVVGFNHTDLSFRILKPMKLSLQVLRAVKLHHDEMAADYNELPFILALANVLSKFKYPEDQKSLDLELTDQFNITSASIPDLETIYDELEIELEFV